MPICFTLEPRPPFRLDLTAWALRRRPGNVVDRWDGTTYRRVMSVAHSVVEVEIRQIGPSHTPRLAVSAATAASLDVARVRAELTATLRRSLGLDADLDDFYRRAADDPDLGPL